MGRQWADAVPLTMEVMQLLLALYVLLCACLSCDSFNLRFIWAARQTTCNPAYKQQKHYVGWAL